MLFDTTPKARSARSLFRAIRGSDEPREKDDFYPTPPEATRAILSVERERISALGGLIWEPAAGDGAICKEISRAGFRHRKSDLVDRGCAARIKSFYEFRKPLAPVIVSNPPYKEINASDGHGRWLAHTMKLGVDLCIYLLNWDWPAAVKNGFSKLLEVHPISRVWLCRWKIDFTGGGSPPQRNAWFVWDRAHDGPTELRFLDRVDAWGSPLLGGAT